MNQKDGQLRLSFAARIGAAMNNGTAVCPSMLHSPPTFRLNAAV